MTISEKLMGTGQWSIPLSRSTPWWVQDRLNVGVNGFGHVVVLPNHLGLESTSEADRLAQARFVGIYRDQPSRFEIGGPSLYAWITDEDGKFHSFGTGLSTATGTFAQWVAQIIGAVPFTTGFTSTVAGNMVRAYSALWPTTRALQDMCDYFGIEYRVNTNFTMDFGTINDLYTTTPKTIVVSRKADGGRDFGMLGLVGDLNVSRDLDDWVRTVREWWGSAPNLVTGTGGVTAANVPFRSPDGTAIEMSVILNDTTLPNSTMAQKIADARWAALNTVHQELRVTTSLYDVGRDVRVGDSMYVWAPEYGLFDTTKQVQYRGETIFPQSLRCVGLTYPVRRGMGVYFRRAVNNGTTTWPIEWTDLTPYVEFEDGDATVEVASKPRKIGT